VEKLEYLDKWHQERVDNRLPYFDATAKELVTELIQIHVEQ